MTIPAEAVTQFDAAYNYTPVLCLVTSDLDSYTCTADNSSNTFTATNHGYANGTPVRFSNSGGVLPSGIDASIDYFVISATTNTFKVSETIGGSEVDLTSNGSGTQTVTEQSLGDGKNSGDLIRRYTDTGLIWDVLVRHEVASYNGASRIGFVWDAATQNTTTGQVTIPTETVSIIPTTASLTFRYAVILRGGNTTLGDSTGGVAIIDDFGDTVISLQGQSFTYSPIYNV